MAIIKRGKRYQIKVRGSDGAWISETFGTKREADDRDAELKLQKRTGNFISNSARQLTLNQYFAIWHEDTKGMRASEGWRDSQIQMFKKYVAPTIGATKIHCVSTAMISKVLQKTSQRGCARQTCLHVFGLLHKLFRDAIEHHEILSRSPVKKSLKPQLITTTEKSFLTVPESMRLLEHVSGKSYEVAVWLGVYIGLRVGEIQALLWSNVDLDRGYLHVRRTYVRREKRFKEYPKGGKWHDVALPPELQSILRKEKEAATTEFVVTSPRKPFLAYDGYCKALRRYCKDAGIREVSTHGLRHSTAEVWMGAGATKEDMQALFAHSDASVTKRYIHFDTAKKLGKVANVIRLFPEKEQSEGPCSQNVPQSTLAVVDAV